MFVYTSEELPSGCARPQDASEEKLTWVNTTTTITFPCLKPQHGTRGRAQTINGILKTEAYVADSP